MNTLRETDPLVAAIFDAVNKCDPTPKPPRQPTSYTVAVEKWLALYRAGQIAKGYMDEARSGFEVAAGEWLIPLSTLPPYQR